MNEFANPYSVERKDAAEMLGISLRTLDRYIRSGKFDFRKIDRKVMLNRAELGDLTRKYDILKASENIIHKNIPYTQERKIKRSIISGDAEESGRVESGRVESERIFQKLYTDILKEMKEQQKRLEGANYRVGQLEAELKNTIPLLEYRTETALQEEKSRQLMEQLKKEEQEIRNIKLTRQEETRRMSHALRMERLNKIAYAIVLCVIVALQPIIWMMVK